MAEPIWVIMPIAGAEEYTDAAISDALAQSVPTRLLLINQGVDSEFRRKLERIAEAHEERVFLWSHDPPLPSLAATWNRALQFCWETGATEVLVVNNDVRLHAMTVLLLREAMRRTDALFVSAVGVHDESQVGFGLDLSLPEGFGRGGPDFSCFLISKEAHAKYPFDEGFIPAFCEDLDAHRRYMLGGDGDKIFSVNLPYLHYGSQTLKSMDPPTRARVERQITERSRAHYQKKWGGAVNQERFTVPFDESSAKDGVTTPELQKQIADVHADAAAL